MNVQSKTERLRWHPDRFAACKEEYKERFQAMAGEVFKVINKMFEEDRDGKRARY